MRAPRLKGWEYKEATEDTKGALDTMLDRLKENGDLVVKDGEWVFADEVDEDGMLPEVGQTNTE